MGNQPSNTNKISNLQNNRRPVYTNIPQRKPIQHNYPKPQLRTRIEPQPSSKKTGDIVMQRVNVLPPQRHVGDIMPYPESSQIVPKKNIDLNNISYKNVNETIDQFKSSHKSDEQQFLAQIEQQKNNFYKNQNDKYNKFKNELDNFERIYNPFKILKLDYNADEVSIKKAYRKLSMKYHPDKGGDVKKFQLITKAYLYLLNKIKETRGIKSHSELRNDAQDYFENDQPQPIIQNQKETINVNDKSFDVNKFNKIFNDNKIGSVYDKGYGDGWDEDNDSEDVVFDKKFSLDVFNSVFNKQKEKRSERRPGKQVLKIDHPEPMLSTGLQFEELGLDNINDFSSATHENMGFTDYKSAYHTNNILEYDDSTKRQDYKNVNDLENERSKISYNLSDEDSRKLDEIERYDKEQEEKRIQNMMAYDQMVERHHQQISSRFIKN